LKLTNVKSLEFIKKLNSFIFLFIQYKKELLIKMLNYKKVKCLQVSIRTFLDFMTLTFEMAWTYSRELYYGFNMARRRHCEIGACLGWVLKALTLQLYLPSARFYWKPVLLYLVRVHIRTRANVSLIHASFARYREETDARIINWVCRNHRLLPIHELRGTLTCCFSNKSTYY